MKKTILLILACTTLASCAPSAEEVVQDAARGLADISSGTLSISMSSETGDGNATAGFTLTGPFALPEPGALPVADLTYQPLGGGEEESVRFVSDGSAAFLVARGEVIELSQSETAGLVGGEDSEADNLVSSLEVEDWFVDPELIEVDGSEEGALQEVSGDLDAGAAISDLVTLVNTFGAGLPALTAEDRDSIETAARDGRIEISIGREDRLLRSLVIDLELSAALPERLQTLDILSGVSLHVDLAIDAPNEDIPVPLVPPQA